MFDSIWSITGCQISQYSYIHKHAEETLTKRFSWSWAGWKVIMVQLTLVYCMVSTLKCKIHAPERSLVNS